MTATGPRPIYKNGNRSSFQGWIKAAIAAGQRMEAAMARRIFPESTTAGWGATALLP